MARGRRCAVASARSPQTPLYTVLLYSPGRSSQGPANANAPTPAAVAHSSAGCPQTRARAIAPKGGTPMALHAACIRTGVSAWPVDRKAHVASQPKTVV